MSTYSFRNIFLNLSGSIFPTYSIELSSQADTDTYFNRENKYSTILRAKNPIKNSLKISYPLTGYDIVRNYIVDDYNNISGSFGGFYFSGAKLKSYSFGLNPNSEIIINAEFNFWGPITGSFQTFNQIQLTGIEKLDTSNITFTNTKGLFNFSTDSINSLNYSYDADLEPDIRSQQTIPDKINVLRKVIQVNFDTDDTNYLLPISGERIQFNINTNNKTGTTLNSYMVNGFILQKQISIEQNQTIKNQYSITQYIVQEDPIITNYTKSGYYFNQFILSGQNIENVASLYFNNSIQQDFSISGYNTIITTVPVTARSGIFGIISRDSKLITGGYFNLLDSGINVMRVTPISGSYYSSQFNKVTISGNGFFNIDRVLFGGQDSKSYSINPAGTLIQAYVPEYALYSPIIVYSTTRNKIGASSNFFVPIPTPRKYEIINDPLNYNIGNTVLCPSGLIRLYGSNFNAVSGIMVNNILAQISNYQIITQTPNLESYDVRIPSGNTNGVFKLIGLSGIQVNSNFEFKPKVYISGVGTSKSNIGNSVSGIAGAGIIYIKLKYKMNEIMSQPASKQYYVTIGNFLTGNSNKTIFRQLEPSTDPDIAYYITGLFPISGANGTIKVWMNDGSYSENTGVKAFYIKPPTVYYVDNNIITGHLVSGKNITYLKENVVVIGENLQYVTGIKYKLFDPFGSPFPDNAVAPEPTGNYPYWSGFTVESNGRRLIMPTTGTYFTMPSYTFLDPRYSGISGAIANGSTTSALSSAILLSPYGNVPLQYFFTEEYTGINGTIYPTWRNSFYIGDYRYSTLPTGGVLSPSNAGELIPSLAYLYRSGFAGINDWRLLFSGYTGSKIVESDIRNGFVTGSGVQTRREWINRTPFGYGVKFYFEGRSGWNFYATGFYSQQSANRSPWSGSGPQFNAGWGLPRTVYFAKAGKTITPYLYIAVSGHVLNTGNNYFRYQVYGDDGYNAYLSGNAYAYA